MNQGEEDFEIPVPWFSAPAYVRADFDRPGLDWKFLGGDYTDNYDLFGDGVLRMIFTPGHSPGHQSFLFHPQAIGGAEIDFLPGTDMIENLNGALEM